MSECESEREKGRGGQTEWTDEACLTISSHMSLQLCHFEMNEDSWLKMEGDERMLLVTLSRLSIQSTETYL